MAICKTRIFVNHWLASQSFRQDVRMRLCSALSDERIISTSVERRNVSTNSKVDERNRHHRARDSNTGHFSAFSMAAGTSVLLIGFLYYHKRRSATTQLHLPFTRVYAAVPEYNKASGDTPTFDGNNLPPSRRFNFIADVVEKTAPGVVYIQLKERLPFTNKPVTVANGSGFVVRGDGLIITNAHVVANRSAVSVKLFDGRQVEGKVVAVDPVSDLACIKVDVPGMLTLKMGKSANVRAGEWVIAMGSPLALSNSVTSGIVSSVSRRSKDIGLKNRDMDYIQTDALINFGNSGGPLLNLDGEVIGINTMKVTPGISFAIPADYVSSFLYKVDQIVGKSQPLKRQWFGLGPTDRKRFIGITMLTLNQQLLMDLRTRVPDFPMITGGVLVHKIVVGSPAFLGGLRAGDIIVDINGNNIKVAADVYGMVEKEDTLSVTIYRGDTPMTFTVKPEEVN